MHKEDNTAICSLMANLYQKTAKEKQNLFINFYLPLPKIASQAHDSEIHSPSKTVWSIATTK